MKTHRKIGPDFVLLRLEPLEERTLLAAPFITSVTPGNGSSVVVALPTDPPPTLRVTFSEDMLAADVQTTGNYYLFTSNGQPVTVNSAVYDSAAFTVTLTYNNNQPLSADTYTLLVRGDQLHDAVVGLPMAPAGQLVIANQNTRNISVVGVNTPNDSQVEAATNYTIAGFSPRAALLIDDDQLRGGGGSPGTLDLLVASLGFSGPVVNIFRGRAGGGFGATPIATLNLPTGANPTGVAVGNFDGRRGLDIAVSEASTTANPTGEVTVFLSSAFGTLSYAPAVSYVSGQNPLAILAADIDGDNNMDLVVANSPAAGINNVTVLPGSGFLGLGVFGAGVSIDTTATGSLTDLASFGAFRRNLVVSSNSGTIVLTNTSVSGTITLTPTILTGSLPSNAVAVGDINGGSSDIVAVATGGQLQSWSGPGFAGPPVILGNVGFNLGGAIAIRNLDNLNGNDVVVANGFSANTMKVLLQTTTAGTFAAPVTYATDRVPVALALGDTNQDGIVDAVIANQSASNISVFRGSSVAGFADGGFWAETNYSVGGAGTQPQGVVTGDLNGDGLPDIVVAKNGSNQAGVFLSTGLDAHGLTTYGPITNYLVGTQPVSVALGDFDGNNGLDIAVANQGSDDVTVLFNNSTGLFGTIPPATVSVGNSPTQVVVADFNKDGNLDLAVSHNQGANRGVTLLFGNGNGTFQPPVEIAAGVRATALATGDFNQDGNPDLVVANDLTGNGQIRLLVGNGAGVFSTAGTYFVSNNPNSIAVADLNRDGFADLVVSSANTPTSANLNVMLNSVGSGFAPANSIALFAGAQLQTVAITNVNSDPFPDLVVSLNQEDFEDNNLYALLSMGDGSFQAPAPYFAGGSGGPPSFVTVASDPLITASSFTVLTSNVTANLIRNGTFEVPDLNGDPGSLSGWQTYEQDNSVGRWNVQTPNIAVGTNTSPLSQTSVAPPPQGSFAAMLDQVDISLPGLGQVFAGTHLLYQDVTIPANTTQATLSFSLFFDSSANFSDTVGGTQPLDFTDPLIPNQQIRVDLMDPAASPLDLGSGVLQMLFITDPSMATVQPYTAPMTITSATEVGTTVTITTAAPNNFVNDQAVTISGVSLSGYNGRYTITVVDPTTFTYTAATAGLANGSGGAADANSFDVTAFKGRTVRLRFAATNNQDSSFNSQYLIVGVDKVRLDTTFIDTTKPTLSNVALRNPGFGAAAGFAGFTTDPTIIGRVNDNGSSKNVAFITAVTTNATDNSVTTSRITNLDALGNFSLALPLTNFGTYNVSVQATDRAGLVTTSSLAFNLQGPSVTNWAARGPGAITTSGVNYPTVSGRITGIALDPRDSSGSTFYVGSANGGVWKTSNSGHDWTPLTDGVVDSAGKPVNVPIGSLALDPVNPNIIYAGTGVADAANVSYAGSGILKSVNGGVSWTLVGASVFNGARIAKIAVANANALQPQRVYVAVASGGISGPGLYLTEDGGATWINVLQPTSNMFLAPNPPGGLLGAGVPLGSVTDVVINPFNPENVYVGIGNIGLVATSDSAGVWRSPNHGGSWQQLDQSVNGINNGDLPSGVGVGRVTIGLGNGRFADAGFVYVLMATASPFPLFAPPNSLDTGSFMGLFASRNGGSDWTKVMLRQPDLPTVPPSPLVYQDIDPMENDGGYAGALVVDPINPYVVFLGGSRRFEADPLTQQFNHPLLRVDTQGMRDHQTIVLNDPMGPIPNDGDDRITRAYALSAVGAGNFPAIPAGYPYTTGAYSAVGMSWIDLENNVSNTFVDTFLPTTIPDRLPSTIHALFIDQRGRLLIGTDGGLWRSNTVGFADARLNDLADQTGLTRDTLPALESNLTLTVLNGNLQIADLNSVAVDPTDRNTFYSGQAGTGFAKTTGSLIWQTMGLYSTNLIRPGLDRARQDNGGVVRVAPPAPGSAPGTPSRVYTTWEYADFSNGLGVQASSAGGAFGSFLSINNGLQTNDQASLIMPLSLNPNKISETGSPQDELLYGTNRFYRTNSSGNQWDLFTRVFTAAEGRVTALASAPSGIYSFYVGTDQGQVFVDLNDGFAQFPNRTNQLPGTPASPVNGFAVYPGDPLTKTMVTIAGTTYERKKVAFVMLGGTGAGAAGHVWRTLDGGVNWTEMSTGLPDVPAYSMVIDDRAQLGTPNGKIYVGTAAGVYISNNNGASWVRLGQGMPNVPIVDLQLLTSLNVRAVTVVSGGSGYSATATPIFSASPAGGITAIGTATVGVGGVITNITITNPGYGYLNTAPPTIVGFTGNAPTQVANFNVITSAAQSILVAGTRGRGAFTIDTSPLTPIPDQFLTGKSPQIPLTVYNPGGVAYTLEATSSNQAMVKNANIVFSGATTGQNRTIQVTPELGAFGTTTITVTLTSTSNPALFYTEAFKVTVSTIGNLVVDMNSTLAIPFVVGDVATALAALNVTTASTNRTLVADSTTPPSGLVVTGAGANRTLTITPNLGKVGTTLVTLTLTDSSLPPNTLATTTFALLVTKNVTLPFADDFNRANNTIFLGPGWDATVGSFTLASDRAAAGPGLGIVTLRQLSAANLFQQADINVAGGTPGQDMGFIARKAPGAPNNYYVGRIVSVGAGFQAQISLVVNSVVSTVLAVKAVASGVGSLRFEVVGTSLKLFFTPAAGPTVILYANNSTLKLPGAAGLRSALGNASADNFLADAIVLPPNPLPFIDSLAVPGPFNQLSSNWLAQAGNFNLSSGAAVGQSSLSNLATVTNLAALNGDVSVQASVSFSAVNQNAGLVARYSGISGLGNANYYLGMVKSLVGGKLQSYLFKNVNGTFIQIGTSQIRTSAGGTLIFQVEGRSLKLFLNGTLIAYGQDSKFTSGSVGIRTGGNASISSFQADAIIMPANFLPFTDNLAIPGAFNQLGLNWLEQAGNFNLSSGAAVGQSSGGNLATVTNLAAPNGNVSVQAVVSFSAVGQNAGLVARYSGFSGLGNANYYLGLVKSLTGGKLQSYLFKNVNGTFVQIGTSQIRTSAGGTLVFQVAGPSLKLFLNGSLIAYGQDTTFTSGSVGMRGVGAATFSGFQASTIGTPSTAPFSDTFALTATPMNQLNDTWIERDGNFDLSSGNAVGKGAMNLATVNGLTAADVDLQAVLNFTTIGQSAGLVARYSGPGEKNFYLATITFTGGANPYTVRIWRNINGVFTQIGPTFTSAFAGGFRFQVVGTSLNVYLDGNVAPILSVIDASISAAGFVGMRTRPGVRVTSFSAT